MAPVWKRPYESRGRSTPIGVGTQRGFTLLEVMVATVILVIIAGIAYGSLNRIGDQYAQAQGAVAELAGMQRTMMFLSQDLLQIQPRSVREEFHGDRVPAVRGGQDHEYALEFTRGGWSNPAQRRRATLQRVAWRLGDEGRLERLHWQVLDRAQLQEPIVTPLLEGVVAFEWRFMGRDREWHDAWPPLATTQVPPDELPRAAEVTITLEDGGEIRRMFTLDAR